MEDTSGLSTSKVTVEYHDPAGVFPLLSAQLEDRLPLRNLHWKSATRPLRSIESLHVDLVSAQAQSTSDAGSRPPTSASQDSVSSQSLHRNSQAQDAPVERPGSGMQPFRPLPKGRRHQIPGLRRTPYLKVYLLRCDDSETYKTISRQQIRDWVRLNTLSSKEIGKKASAQENHDAFEWLILHVVMPNTSAASQPRFSGSISDSTGTAKDRSNKTKWPGGKSNTIFEKIRSDFNSSSSRALDRVAQIRLQPEDLPSDRQSAAPVLTIPAWQETPSERNNAWTDVIGKLKTLILESFDHRVDQYEEDIRERDAQRSLPGWNFCTFFVLKEGLARSFEGVGLVEDALVIYDELSLGLDTSLEDKADSANDTSATTFIDHTEDMLRALRKVIDSNDVPLDVQKLMRRPVDEYNKPYREMILQNNISIFDFRCYIFARQLALLLRLGRATPSLRHDLQSSEESRRLSLDDGFGQKKSLEAAGAEDLSALAESCRRALTFATNVARALRTDLIQKVAKSELRALQNFVWSWSAAVVEQVLVETRAAVLRASNRADSTTSVKLPKARPQNIGGGPGGSDRPTRSSSLSYRPKASADPPYTQTNGETVFDRNGITSPNRARLGDAGRSGLTELASHRAALNLLERRLLEALGQTRGWSSGWSAIGKRLRSDASPGNSINGEHARHQSSEPSASETEVATPALLGLCVPRLIEAMASEDAFRHALQVSNAEALANFLAGDQTKSAEIIYADLAVIKFDSGDYAGASKYFEHVTPAFGGTKWNQVEVALLRMQAQCLKALNRKDEYIRVLLVILQKAATRAKRYNKVRDKATTTLSSRGKPQEDSWLDDSDVQAKGILDELIEYSQELPYDISVPMLTYFDDVVVQTDIGHHDNKDGMSLSVQFHHLLNERFTCDAVQLKLIGTTNEQKRDLLLQTSEPLLIGPGRVGCSVSTNVTTYGSFLVEKLAIRANKILFLYEPLAKPEPTFPLSSAPPAVREPNEHLHMTRILCHPRAGALNAKLGLSRAIRINKPRSIELWCCVGSNSLEKFELRLRAASAGLRLHTSKAVVTEGNAISIKPDMSRPGMLELDSSPAGTTFRIQIPYETDTNIPEILVRLDVDYSTQLGAFQFFDHAKIPVELPLDVNVQDSFKPFALFSTFNIRTPDHRPLRLMSASLDNAGSLEIDGPHGGPLPRVVIPQKTSSLQYVLKHKKGRSAKSKDPLALTLEYRCFDELLGTLAEYALEAGSGPGLPAFARRLVVPYFADHLMFHLQSRDWTQLAYQDEVPVPSFNNFGWEDVLDAVRPERREELQRWLQQWHADNAKITLGNIHVVNGSASSRETASSSVTRSLTIPVTIPTVQLSPFVSLQIQGYERSYLPTDPPWCIGEAKRATLTISHTRLWGDADELKRLARLESGNDPVPLMYEIDCNPDIWLVGGPKRGVFSQKEGDEDRFTLDLLLVPLRKGDWAVPSVEVKPHMALSDPDGRSQSLEGRDSKGNSLERSVPEGEEISCETYYEQQFMRVLVMPEVRSTTTSLMQGDGEETMLLDSRQAVRTASS